MAKEIILDAADKKLGRLASQVALALRGKTKEDFLPHSKNLPKVFVKNVNLMIFSEKKLKSKTFKRYSGYPGGLKRQSAYEVFLKDKKEVLRRAVLGMLPKNKLRKMMVKNMILQNG